MKKILILFGFIATLVACNGNSVKNTEEAVDSLEVVVDSVELVADSVAVDTLDVN